jgi:hypothetical protein
MIQFEIENELITDKEINDFEKKLKGFKLPDDYKGHMLKYNGGVTLEFYEWYKDDEVQFLYFLPLKFEDNNMENALISKEGILPESDIFIGSIRGGKLCMSLARNGDKGSVYAFFSDGEKLDLANSFTEFVNGLVLSEE